MAPSSITPRKMDFDFTAVPRHWFAGSAAATHLANGINLLFPQGERFFVRSVMQLAERITDPRLRADIKAFASQEGKHAHAHADYADVMRQQGYEVDSFLAWFERWQARLNERSSPTQRLAVTAACEHFTAIMAENTFTEPNLELMHPTMAALFAWHAVEELEHKAVAFDVLKAVDPSYRTRVRGLAQATLTLAACWFVATRHLLRQEGMSWRAARAELKQFRRRSPIVTSVFLRGIREYLRPSFHPNDRDTGKVAEAWYAAHVQVAA